MTAGVPVVPTMPPPSSMPPPASPSSGGAGPRWLWALGGVVLASVTWAGTLFATGALGQEDEGSPAKADFAGYRFHHDMCTTAALKSFRAEYEISKSPSGTPDGYSSRQKGLDESECSPTMTEKGDTSSTPATTYVTTTVRWHKRSDPEPEFASKLRVYEDQKGSAYKYTVKPLKGFGDEAYLVVEKRGQSLDSLGSVDLAVRVGWMTYEMRWSWFGGGVGEKSEPPTLAKVTRMMKTDTRATLAALKKPDTEEGGGRDPGA